MGHGNEGCWYNTIELELEAFTVYFTKANPNIRKH